MAALDGTVALVQMEDVAVFVTEELDFDMFGAADEFFEKDSRIAESAIGFTLGLVEQTVEVFGFFNHAHTASAAAESRLDDEREAEFSGDLECLLAVGDGVFGAGQGGNLKFLRQFASCDFVAHQVEQFRVGSDEGDSRLGAGAGEIGVLGEESVPGVDQIDAVVLGEGDDAVDVEIGADGAFALTDEIRFIGLEAVHAETVFLRENGDRAQTEFARGAENANGNFAAVGDKEFSLSCTGGGGITWNGSGLRSGGGLRLAALDHKVLQCYTRYNLLTPSGFYVESQEIVKLIIGFF